jgi:adenylate kinase family enzyme
MTERILNRAKTSGRSDDNADSIKLRLGTFHNETLPIL